MAASHVFTPEFVADMRRRYDRFPEYQRPLVAKIATAEYREDDRERIESWVSRLGTEDLSKLTALLRDADHFLHTYNELAFAQLLLDEGWTVEYERPYDLDDGRLTPDWTITRGDVHVVCDVFTAGLIDDRGRIESATRQLIGRLSVIKAPHLVRLDVPHGFQLPAPHQKQLCAEFAKWLRTGVGIGSVWQHSDCTIEVVGPSRGNIDVMATDAMHIVPTATSITTNLRAKAKKYGALRVPLLVAAVKHPDAEADATMFSDCVLGEFVYRSFQLPGGSIVGGTDREPGGAFDGRPELSAAFWLNPYAIGRAEHLLITNPSAARPLPDPLISTLGPVHSE
jgi:hypothetical protein